MRKLLILLPLVVPVVGCSSPSEDAPVLKGDPPPVVQGAGPSVEHVRGGHGK